MASRFHKILFLDVSGLVLAALFLLQGCTGAGDSGTLVPQGTAGDSPALGVNASLQGARPFPDDNPWNTPIDSDPVDPDSDLLIDSIGRTASLHPDFGADWNGGPFGIPYVVVSGDTPGCGLPDLLMWRRRVRKCPPSCRPGGRSASSDEKGFHPVAIHGSEA
jgi:hypothetical protein